jgi:hypothetical protein
MEVVRHRPREPLSVSIVEILALRSIRHLARSLEQLPNFRLRHRVALDVGGHVCTTGLNLRSEPPIERNGNGQALDLSTEIL